MAHSAFLQRHGPKLIVALLLAFGSGLVDIIGYLGVFHLFTAHLTGTTVQLGRSLVDHVWTDALAAAIIVIAFMCGSLAGRAAIEMGSRKHNRSIASATLATEMLLLLLVLPIAGSFVRKPYAGIALLAAAMGMQTATLTGVGPLTVHTTFVTEMMNKIAQLVSHIGFRAYDLRKPHSKTSAILRDQRRDMKMLLFLSGIWGFYVAGAILGTWSFNNWKLKALSIAIALLILCLAVDQWWPLSIEEEKEQSER